MSQRPIISKAKVDADSSLEEAFQNSMLRPIIKMKHDLVLAFTKQYIANKKQDLAALSLKDRIKFVNACFEQDHNFRTEMRGIVIGQFSLEEFETYAKMSKALNKRIMTIIKERMIDHIDLLN